DLSSLPMEDSQVQHQEPDDQAREPQPEPTHLGVLGTKVPRLSDILASPLRQSGPAPAPFRGDPWRRSSEAESERYLRANLHHAIGGDVEEARRRLRAASQEGEKHHSPAA